MDPKRFMKVEKWRMLAEERHQGQWRGGQRKGSKRDAKLGCSAEGEKEKVNIGANGSQEDPIVIE
jgi:hypothetical protein